MLSLPLPATRGPLSPSPASAALGRALTPLFSPYFDGAEREYALAAAFSRNGRLLAFAERPGTQYDVSNIIGAVRSVLARSDADGIVMAHNHVIGGADPSAADWRATRHIARFVRMGGARLLDHLIFGQSGTFSFAANGMI